MHTLKLVLPCKKYIQEIYNYREEFLVRNDDMAGTSNLREFDNILEWINWTKKLSNYEYNVLPYVHSLQFLTINENDKLIGMVDIRLDTNDYILNYGGQLGYSIRPSERNKGYGKNQFHLAINKCKTLGFEQIIITCNKTNIPSKKIIKSKKGILINTINEKTSNDLIERYVIQL